MKYKSTVAQDVFDEASKINKETEGELMKMLKQCSTVQERVILLNVVSERRLLNYLTACEYASRIEMQCAGTAAMVSANLTGGKE